MILQDNIQLAHTMKLEVIAARVETANQGKTLEEISCDIYQGFYFSSPGSCKEIGMLVTHRDKYKFLHEALSSSIVF